MTQVKGRCLFSRSSREEKRADLETHSNLGSDRRLLIERRQFAALEFANSAIYPAEEPHTVVPIKVYGFRALRHDRPATSVLSLVEEFQLGGGLPSAPPYTALAPEAFAMPHSVPSPSEAGVVSVPENR